MPAPWPEGVVVADRIAWIAASDAVAGLPQLMALDVATREVMGKWLLPGYELMGVVVDASGAWITAGSDDGSFLVHVETAGR